MLLRLALNDPALIKKCWKRIYWSKSVSKKSKSKGYDGQTIDDFHRSEVENLHELGTLLEQNRYKLKPLEGFAVKKENGIDYRLITSAIVKDRIVHKAILYLINKKLYPFVNTGVSYCGVRENLLSNTADEEVLNTKKAINQLIYYLEKKHFYLFKSDIKAFYDNVPKRRLYNLIVKLSREILKDESLNSLIHDVIFFKLWNKKQILLEKKVSLPNRYTGISQGSALSQYFANIYLQDFDLRMKKIFGKRFIRYVDDFIVICKTSQEAQKAKFITERFLKHKKLTLSKDINKTKIVDIRNEDINFLGLNFSTKKIGWKRKGKKARKWIQDVLNITNVEYYRDCKTFAEKIKKMNQRLNGLEDYLKYYHVQDDFDFINENIRLKIKSNQSYKKLNFLNKENIIPITPLSNWQRLFLNS